MVRLNDNILLPVKYTFMCCCARFSAAGCLLADGSNRDGRAVFFTAHTPPLVFDVTADPQECRPLDSQDLPPSLLLQITAEYNAFWESVHTTFRSVTSYDMSSDDRPCSNALSACCRKGEVDK